LIRSGGDLPKFASLEARPGYGDYWVPIVQRWAQEHGSPIRYIDNCWLGIAVSAADLVEFLRSLDQPGNSWIEPLIDRVDQADSYLVWAEEY